MKTHIGSVCFVLLALVVFMGLTGCVAPSQYHPSTTATLEEANDLLQESRKFYDKNDYDNAIDRGERALAIAKNHLDDDSMDIEKFYRSLAVSYLGKAPHAMLSGEANALDELKLYSEKAKPLLKKALSIHEKNFGRDHPETMKLRKYILDLYGTSFFKD